MPSCQDTGAGLHPRRAQRSGRGHARLDSLGSIALNVYFHDRAFWRNVPLPIWRYEQGRYQMLKGWLPHRERGLLGRTLLVEKVSRLTEMGRRIGGISVMPVGGTGK